MRNISYIFAAGILAGVVPISANAQGTPAAGAFLAEDARHASDRADDKVALSDQWRKGERMATDGEKLLKRSNQRLAKLARDAKAFEAKADEANAEQAKEQDSQAKGRKMIADGRSLQAQAEGRSQTGSGA